MEGAIRHFGCIRLLPLRANGVVHAKPLPPTRTPHIEVWPGIDAHTNDRVSRFIHELSARRKIAYNVLGLVCSKHPSHAGLSPGVVLSSVAGLAGGRTSV